jgi:hypothetical protein
MTHGCQRRRLADIPLAATVLSPFVPVLKHLPEAELGPVQPRLFSALFEVIFNGFSQVVDGGCGG